MTRIQQDYLLEHIHQSPSKAVKKQSRILQNPSKYRNLEKKTLDGRPEAAKENNASIYFHNDTHNWPANEYKEEPKHKRYRALVVYFEEL